MSIDDNDIGDVIAIAIGTSMLQFKNIVKKPVIWVPPIIVSAIIAPVSTCLLNISCSPVVWHGNSWFCRNIRSG